MPLSAAVLDALDPALREQLRDGAWVGIDRAAAAVGALALAVALEYERAPLARRAPEESRAIVQLACAVAAAGLALYPQPLPFCAARVLRIIEDMASLVSSPPQFAELVASLGAMAMRCDASSVGLFVANALAIATQHAEVGT